MTIKYWYSQAGEAHEGEMQRTTHMVGSHEVVRAVMQQIANDTGETVRFSMLNPTGTAVVGTDPWPSHRSQRWFAVGRDQ
jgi:hypothetical protein